MQNQNHNNSGPVHRTDHYFHGDQFLYGNMRKNRICCISRANLIVATVGMLFASYLLGCELADPVDEMRSFEDSLMVNILTDAFVLQAAFADTYGDVKDSMAAVYSEQLLTKYDISKEEFDYNIERIFEDPVRADSILQKILDRVDFLERNIDFESEENNPVIE